MEVTIDLGAVPGVLLALLPGALWTAWWLLSVDWRRMGPFLRAGAWAPAVLLILVAALAWSRIDLSDRTLGGLFTIPNFWWQLASVVMLALDALFCGWLQGLYGWYPPEIAVEPPAHGHGAQHVHGHGEGHHGHHAGNGHAGH